MDEEIMKKRYDEYQIYCVNNDCRPVDYEEFCDVCYPILNPKKWLDMELSPLNEYSNFFNGLSGKVSSSELYKRFCRECIKVKIPNFMKYAKLKLGKTKTIRIDNKVLRGWDIQ